MDESTKMLSSSSAEWPLWERDNCTLDRSFAATQTEAAELKLLESQRGFALLQTEMGKEFGIYSGNEEIPGMKQVLVWTDLCLIELFSICFPCNPWL